MMRLPVCITIVLLSCVAGRRFRLAGISNSSETIATYDVKLLVTRHALSWANIASQWMGSTVHVRFRDALLTQVGIAKSVEAGKRIKEWLEHPSRNWTIDGVISSTLARAMQTALFQYPGHTVEVAPFIAEHGVGEDNKPRERGRQVEHLVNHMRSSQFNIDYRWSEVFEEMNKKQQWSLFLKFLESSYLPNMIQLQKARNVPLRSPIVLAVVTHSNFMNEGSISEKCSSYFPEIKGSTKANNNQAVLLPYTLTAKADPKWDVTERYTLSEPRTCESVDLGTSPIDPHTGELHKLCLKDIGEDCYNYAIKKAKAFKGLTQLKPPILEDEMAQAHHDLRKKRAEADVLRNKMTSPSSRKTKKREDRFNAIEKAIEETQSKLRTLESTQCWLGGYPVETPKRLQS